MAEILEYCLVFLVSMLFVAGSVATYGSFSGFASGLQFRVASSSISRIAAEALANGTAAATVTVPPSTLACRGAVLTFASGTLSSSVNIPGGCDFSFSLSGGEHSLGFSYGRQQLTATVS